MPNAADTIDHSGATRDPFAISPRQVGDHTCVVSLEGEIDLAAAPTVKSSLLELVRDGHRQLIVDLSLVRHLDSTGLGVLVGLRKRLADEGRLAIAGAPRNVLRLFQITGLDAKFEMFTTLDGALADMRDSSASVRPAPPC
jgi:anti-sigma B factor antagonist